MVEPCVADSIYQLQSELSFEKGGNLTQKAVFVIAGFDGEPWRLQQQHKNCLEVKY